MPRRGQAFHPPLAVPAPKEVYNVRVYSMALIASMGAVIFGYDLAFIGTTITLTPFERDFGLIGASKDTLDAFAANVVSLLQAGCFFGAIFGPVFSDRFGRKPMLIASAVVFCVGSLIQTFCFGAFQLLWTGRLIGGLGVGAASGVVPLYVAELAPTDIRGALVGTYEVAVQVGTCIGFWICYGVQKNVPSSGSRQWMIPFAVQLIPGGLLFIGSFFVPESPRWQAARRPREQALTSLAKLRNLPEDHPYVVEEMSHLGAQTELDRVITEGTHTLQQKLQRAMKPNIRRRFILTVFIFIFMQFAGSNAINYYSPRVFQSIGLTGDGVGLLATGIYGIVRLITVIISMFFVVDRFGRTKMLITGSIVMGLAMWYLGAFVKVSPTTTMGAAISPGGYAAAVFIYVYAIGFCFSYAGIPWIITSEIFPLHFRATGIAVGTATHWLLNFIIARSVPYMFTNIGFGTYFVFASFITLSIPFVYFFVPETKSISLEDMDGLFGSRQEDIEAVAMEGKHAAQSDYVEQVQKP